MLPANFGFEAVKHPYFLMLLQGLRTVGGLATSPLQSLLRCRCVLPFGSFAAQGVVTLNPPMHLYGRAPLWGIVLGAPHLQLSAEPPQSSAHLEQRSSSVNSIDQQSAL